MNIGTVISKVIQLLFILLVGIYTRKREFIDRSTVKSLAKYLSNVTNPLLIVCSFQLDYSTELLILGGKIFIGALLIHVVSAILAYLVFRPKKGSCENAIYEFTVIFGNCAFMGFPILAAVYGDIGIVYGSFYNAVFNLFFWTYGILILTRHKNTDGKMSLNWKQLILNPGVLATVGGILLYVLQIKIPDMLLGGMKMVGDSTFPLAMIIIGALIVELDFKAAFRDLKFYIGAALKLLIIPGLALLFCVLFRVEPLITYVLVTLSAMPSATFGAIFAEIYGVNPVTGAKIVCLTTILSIATVPLLLFVAQAALGV